MGRTTRIGGALAACATMTCGGQSTDGAPEDADVILLREAALYASSLDAAMLFPGSAARAPSTRAAADGTPAPLAGLVAAIGARVDPSCVDRTDVAPTAAEPFMGIRCHFACDDGRSSLAGAVVMRELSDHRASVGLDVAFEQLAVRVQDRDGTIRSVTLDGNVTLRSLDRFRTAAAAVQTFTMKLTLTRGGAEAAASIDVYTLSSYTPNQGLSGDPLARGALVFTGVALVDHAGVRDAFWRFSETSAPLTWDRTCLDRAPGALGFASGRVVWWAERAEPLHLVFANCAPRVGWD